MVGMARCAVREASSFPNSSLGMTMSPATLLPCNETEFRRQVRSQTEFGNEEDAAARRPYQE
jgi:hypothetical protein